MSSKITPKTRTSNATVDNALQLQSKNIELQASNRPNPIPEINELNWTSFGSEPDQHFLLTRYNDRQGQILGPKSSTQPGPRNTPPFNFFPVRSITTVGRSGPAHWNPNRKRIYSDPSTWTRSKTLPKSRRNPNKAALRHLAVAGGNGLLSVAPPEPRRPPKP